MKKEFNTGVIIARFHVDNLHIGHTQLITTALSQCDKLIIFLGTSVVRDSDRNPLDFRTRELMVRANIGTLNHALGRTLVLPLPDCHSDEVWSAELDRRIHEIDPQGSVRLYGSRDSFEKHYTGRHQIVHVNPVNNSPTGTEVRRSIAGKPLPTADFRRGVIYAKVNQWPKVHPCIDVAITRVTSGKVEVLLGRKHNEERYRLIGGFVDPEDHRYATLCRDETT